MRVGTAVAALRYRTLAWLAILGPAGVVFCLLLLRDSFYVAITRAAALAVIGLFAVAAATRLAGRSTRRTARPGPR